MIGTGISSTGAVVARPARAHVLRRDLLRGSVGMAMLGLAGCETIGVYRFRLTVEIDTPHGLRTGSSVMQVRYSLGVNFNGGGQQSHEDLEGEGAYVDLGDGRNLVAVLGHPLLGSLAWRRLFLPADIFFPNQSGPQQLRDLKASGGKMEGGADLTLDQSPSLVTFERPDDPASARVVYGESIGKVFDGTRERETFVHIDEIAQVFGPGYALRRMRTDIVPRNTPITRQLGQRFPWLNDPNVMQNPGWMALPSLARTVISLMRA